MEQRVDELGALRQETGQFLLQGSVDIIVFVRCNLEVLLKLGDDTSEQDSATGPRASP